MHSQSIANQVRNEVQTLVRFQPVVNPNASLERILEDKVIFLDKISRDLLGSKNPRKYLETFFSFQMNGKEYVSPTANSVIQDYLKNRADIEATQRKLGETITAYELALTQLRLAPELLYHPNQMPESAISAEEIPEFTRDLLEVYEL